MFDKSSWLTLEYHRSMLADTARVSVFRQAIFEAVKPGDIVLDLGTGTGLLSFFACQAGAARVYAIGTGRIVEAARQVCSHNGFDDRVTFINRLSFEVDLPELADVLVTETIGNLGLDENILGNAIDAQKRLLKKNARIIPAALTIHMVPLEAASNYEPIEAWSEPVSGLDFSPVRAIAANNPHWPSLDPATFLGRPAKSQESTLAGLGSGNFETRVTCLIDKPGTLCGVGGWFSARLNHSGTLSINNEPTGESNSWQQAFLPLQTSTSVLAGDVIEISLRFDANASIIRWSIACSRTDDASGQPLVVASHKQSSFLGQMLSVSRLRQEAKGRKSKKHRMKHNELLVRYPR